jgi:hypothetical protein
MKLTESEKTFFKDNVEIWKPVFDRRIDELKEFMVLENEHREDRANLIVELRYFMQDLISKPTRKAKKDNFI